MVGTAALSANLLYSVLAVLPDLVTQGACEKRHSEGVGGMGTVTKPARGSCLKELICPDVAKQV